MSNNTIVRGLLVPSLKNKPLDGRQEVPTLADIANIENPYVNFIFPVEETGKWYKVLSLKEKVVDELVIPDGMIDEYEPFGEGMTDEQKEEYLTKSLAEQTYLKKEDAVEEYLNKTEAEADYLKKEDAANEYLNKENAEADFLKKKDAEETYLNKTDAEGTFLKKEDAEGTYLNKTEAEETYQQKGDYVTTEEGDDKYQPKGDYATKKELDDLEQRISEGGGEGEGGSFIDAPKDGKTYGRKDGLWNELVDAPSDGMAYARINGKWAAIDSGNALDPMLPVLSLTINSSRDEDLTIANVIARVTYADKEFALGNGGKINVPYGLSVTVTFPNVDNYTTPNVVVFDNVQGNISAEGTYIDLRETVDVYVSADDSSSVDGQIVTVGKISRRPNGVYIEDKNGKLWTKEEWDGSVAYGSVVLIHNEHAFGIHGGNFSGILGNESSSAIGAKSHFNIEMAKEDFNGAGNSASIFSTYSSTSDSIAKKIKAIKFATGKSAFIPALGQLLLIDRYLKSVNEMLDFVGESSVSTRYSRSSTFQGTSSSYQSTWCIGYSSSDIKDLDVDVYYTMYGNYTSIACCTISEEQCLYTPEPEEYEVKGGKVSFGALAGDTVSAKVNDKGEGYKTPEEVHLLVQNGENNISLVYNKLIIDTIYINNLIADSREIISGQINGPAVQAIWDGVKRYLGKIVTKEDGAQELVLLDINQDDNLYYKDGIPIDVESLGTSAYFYTVIPSFAYRITQLSDNYYKIDISYKHCPNGDGWKYFDELVTPTFSFEYDGSSISNAFPKYNAISGYGTHDHGLAEYMDTFDIYDYSNLVLLTMARYGSVDIRDLLEEYTMKMYKGVYATGDEWWRAYTGYSLRNGKKDAKYMCVYSTDKIAYAYNILGLENVLYFLGLANRPNDALESSLHIGYRKKGKYNYSRNIIFRANSDSVLFYNRAGEEEIHTVANFENTSSQYVKKLLINDFFLAIPSEFGGDSESYYKSNAYFIFSSSYESNAGIGGMVGWIGDKTTLYLPVGRAKFTDTYRIEESKEAFNELTNIWV